MRRHPALSALLVLLALAIGGVAAWSAARSRAQDAGAAARYSYLRVDKRPGADSALDIRLDGTGRALRVFARGSTSAGTYLNDSGMFYTSGWIVVSGTATGTGENLNIQHASDDPTMISVWSDVGGPAIQLRAANADGAYILSGLDRRGHHTFSVEEDGRLRWGAGPRAALDTGLYRATAGTLRTDGSFAIGREGPASTLHVGGSQSVRRTAVTQDYTARDDDHYLGVTDTAARRTITLPSARGREGRVYIVKDESGGADRQPIAVRAAAGETIDGTAAVEVTTSYGVVRLISNGQNWFRM